MKKRYLKLIKEQKAEGVIFSSQFIEQDSKVSSARINEVFLTDSNQEAKIERLLNDKFFNSSQWNVNIIRR